jgi:hypothetical protein
VAQMVECLARLAQGPEFNPLYYHHHHNKKVYQNIFLCEEDL